jgi:hypothetical protein
MCGQCGVVARRARQWVCTPVIYFVASINVAHLTSARIAHKGTRRRRPRAPRFGDTSGCRGSGRGSGWLGRSVRVVVQVGPHGLHIVQETLLFIVCIALYIGWNIIFIVVAALQIVQHALFRFGVGRVGIGAQVHQGRFVIAHDRRAAQQLQLQGFRIGATGHQ